MLLAQFRREDLAFDLANAGRKTAANTTMHAMVIRSSVTVKAGVGGVLRGCTGMLMARGTA
jgi:pseudouridine-5'-phosphate glycosidase